MPQHLEQSINLKILVIMKTEKLMTELTKEELIRTFGGNSQQKYVLIRVGNKLIWVKSGISPD